jgi:monofunctional biosynthetic peptidoglycan transglycosylase
MGKICACDVVGYRIMAADQGGIEDALAMGATGDQCKTQVDGKPGKAKWRLWRWLLLVPLVLMAFSVMQVLVLRFVDPPFSTVMVGRQFEAWAGGQWRYRIDYRWCDLERMAPSLPISLVAAEDQQFPLHNGFDLQAIEKARSHNARGGRMRGASTISQQVAKNVFLWQGRSWLRKGLEAWYTVLIEALWPKSRILEVYANVAEFGDGIYGVQAASQRYWGKNAAALGPMESARLAAVLPAPRRYNARNPGPYVQRRAVWIQRQARQLGGAAYLQSSGE